MKGFKCGVILECLGVRVLPDSLTFMSLRRYCDSEECRRLCIIEIILYCIRCSIFLPVKGFKCGSDMDMFRGVSDSAGKLKAFNLRERKSMVKRVTIIKTSVYE